VPWVSAAPRQGRTVRIRCDPVPVGRGGRPSTGAHYARSMEPATTIDLGPAATLVPSDDTLADEVLVEEELLVEEISIDGMCGVY